MIEDVGEALDRGGDVVAAGEEDVDRRTGARTGFAIEAGILDKRGIWEVRAVPIWVRHDVTL